MKGRKPGDEASLKRRSALLASVCALLLVVLLGLSFFLSTRAYGKENTTVRPQNGEDQLVDSTIDELAEENAARIAQVTITPQNVQTVIGTLSRPAQYSCAVENTLYWEDGSATLTSRQYARNGAVRTEELDSTGAIVRVSIQYDEQFFAWDAGSSTYYTGSMGAFTADQTAMLPTYETVCDLPAEAILSAELRQEQNEPLIAVRVQADGETEIEYAVSAVTGLLRSAVFYEEGQRVRMVHTALLSAEAPSESLFALPGMTTPVYAVGDIQATPST